MQIENHKPAIKNKLNPKKITLSPNYTLTTNHSKPQKNKKQKLRFQMSKKVDQKFGKKPKNYLQKQKKRVYYHKFNSNQFFLKKLQ